MTHDTHPSEGFHLMKKDSISPKGMASLPKRMPSLLVVSTVEQVNIGDYVQALAAQQYLPEASVYLERERLDTYRGEPVNMIMNGYFMHEPEHWPPSEAINPLFVSFHLNATAAGTLLNEENLEYFKQHQPIGCRDLQTRDSLQAKGIDAYFSACLTLTLGNTYTNAHKDGSVYIVDPCFNVASHSDLNGLRYLPAYLTHRKAIKHIAAKYFTTRKPGLFDLLALTRFYMTYKKVFTPETLLEATYISQQSTAYKTQLDTHDERMAEAKRLVEGYARASLVITSRIHCALPCLGLGTPVVYVYNDLQPPVSSCRMNGLLDLFNVVTWTGKTLRSDLAKGANQRLSPSQLISPGNAPANKPDWKPYATRLTEQCNRWAAQQSEQQTEQQSEQQSEQQTVQQTEQQNPTGIPQTPEPPTI